METIVVNRENYLMANTVFATFDDPVMAEKAAGAMLDHGIHARHISIILPEGYGPDNPDDAFENCSEKKVENGITTTTVSDAASAAAKGAGYGLTVGAFAALASMFIPEVGLVIGGGALTIALAGTAGATFAGAVAGGVTGYMKDQGVRTGDAHERVSAVSEGGPQVSVNLTNENVEASTVEAVLIKYNGSISPHGISGGISSPGINGSISSHGINGASVM